MDSIELIDYLLRPRHPLDIVSYLFDLSFPLYWTHLLGSCQCWGVCVTESNYLIGTMNILFFFFLIWFCMSVYCSFYHWKGNNNEVEYYCSKPSHMIASRADIVHHVLHVQDDCSHSLNVFLKQPLLDILWHSMIPTIRLALLQPNVDGQKTMTILLRWP